ncbi:multi-sensor hybrid histidine kinase [Calothrix sp. NIES-2100]|uniref:PAS domain S-box protein n=1 Tax=Calothrix sp. NIES-2100 TaxID=1954172 RepID=UPI000B5E433A|nr:multi-sensor hybrid histidine kinase [Calothrix sp. NIES-2100]
MCQTGRTLLIVDDSPEDRELYQRYLKRDREYAYNILEATLGQQGLELWAKHQPDVVLLDYRLPDLNGLEFLNRLQSSTQKSCLPVIMVTGEGNEAIAVQAMKAGAQDYLVKEQITPERLQLAINGAIETVELRTQLQQRIDRERLVSKITQQIYKSLNLDEILQTTVAEVRQFLQTDRVLVLRKKLDGNAKVVAESVGATWRSLLSSTIHDPCLAKNYPACIQSESVTSDSAFVENDLKRYWVSSISDIHDGSIDPCYAELLAQFQVKANLVVPIIHDDKFWGLLIVHHCASPRLWQPLEIDLLKEMVIHLSISLRQAELYQQAQDELKERRQVEIELRDSEERFRQLAENTNAVFWIREVPENRVSYVSPAYKRLWGLDPQKLYADQQNWVNYIHPEDRESTHQAFQEKAAAGEFDQEYRIVLPDNSLRWVRDRCFPLRNEAGEIYRFTGIAEDISRSKQIEIELQENRAILQQQLAEIEAIYQTAPIGLNVLDTDLRFVRVNQRLAEMNGLAIEAHIGRTLRELLPGLADDAEEILLPILKTGQPKLNVEIRGETPAQPGKPRIWLEHFLPLKDGDDRIIGISTVCEEITDRKQAELALQERERQFTTLAEASPTAIFRYDTASNCTYVNRRWCEMTDQPPEAALGMGWVQTLHPDDRDRLSQAWLEWCANAKEQGPYQQEGRWTRPDGQVIWFICQALPEIDSNGNVVGYIGTLTDVTDRKQSEQALRQSEERYRCLAELIPQLVWTANAQGALLDVNQRWSEFTGLTLEQARTSGWEQVIHPEDVAVMAQKWAESVNNSTSYQAEGRMRRADGVYRWHLHQAIGPKNEQGEIIKWFGTATDIEAQKQLEIERDRLLQLEQTARAQAERANRIKDEFLAILSHELRSPLNPILGWATLLQTRKLDETKTQEALASIERNAKLQTQLIDDLLDVAKILRGKLTMNADPVNLAFAIEAAIDIMRTAAVAKSIRLHPVLSPVGQVSGDAARLQQIVWNLLSNAIKFTPNNGRVDIRLEQVGNSAKITVSDTGKGINPEFLPHIFESFRQEDASTTRKYGGLGLGLAIVRSLVEAHGGTILAHSPGEGQGATFTVQLPLLDTAPKKSQPHELPEQKADLTGIRVLSVDDEPDTRELFTTLLTQSGAEVLTVAAAAEVLAALETFQPDIIVSDIGMPNVDGYALIQQIRSLPPEQGGKIPAIALTAYARIEDQQRALAAGFQHHISKPIELEKLVQAIADLASQLTVDC